MNLNGVIKIFIGKHSLITLIVILFIIDIILIASAIVPGLLEFIIDKHIFEIVVLTALTEVLLLQSSNLWRETPLAIDSEEEAQKRILYLIKDDTSIENVKVLSAGLRARSILLHELLEKNIRLNLEIVTCFGKCPNPDKDDREDFGTAAFKGFVDRLRQDEARRLKIYNSFNTPSFRCILLTDSQRSLYGIIGWYTYYDRNTKITGRRNMQIFVDRTTETGVALLNFAENIFEKYANEKEAEIIWPVNKNKVSEHENAV